MKALILALVLMLGVAASAAAGPLTLRFADGYVTLSARDVPIREILAQWARTGQTRIVNAERLAGSVTLELDHVPEKQALEIVLRSASGYMAAPRSAYAATLSVFDRIVIMPTSMAAPAPVAAAPRTVRPGPPLPDPNAGMVQPPLDDPDEPIPPNAPGVPAYSASDGPSPNVGPNGEPPFLPPGSENQPGPEAQGPIRPYPTPNNDPNGGQPVVQPVPAPQQFPGPTPGPQGGVLTTETPGQIQPPQKPPQ